MRKLIISLGILAVLLIGIALVVPRLVDVNQHKDTITRLVRQHTGRDLRIEGNIALTILPNIALQADKVTFANAAGFKHPQMLTLESLVLKLQLMPLLHKQIAVDSLVLVKPVIFLEVNKKGVSNWEFGSTATTPLSDEGKDKEPAGMIVESWWAAPAYAAIPSADRGGWSVENLRLNGAEIQQGTLTYENRQTNRTVQLANLDLHLMMQGATQPVTITGSTLWQGRKLRWDVKAETLAALIDHAAAPVPFHATLESDLFSLKTDGTLAVRAKGAEGKLHIAFSASSFPELARWLEVPGKSPFQNSLAVTTDLGLTPAQFMFQNLRINADELQASGDLTLATGGATPHLKGTLMAEKLNLRRFLQKSQLTPAVGGVIAEAFAETADTWSREPIDASGLHDLNADLGITFGSIQLTDLAFGKTVVDLRLKNGKLSTDIKEAAFYDGSITGSVVLNALTRGVGLNGNLALQNVDMKALFTALAHYHDFSGKGTIHLNFNSSGLSSDALIRQLGGNGDMRVLEGSLRNRTLVALIHSAQAGLKSGIDGSGGGGDTLAFSDMSGTFTIQNGIVRNQDLNVVAPSLHMTGNGLVDLPRMYISYRLKPMFSKQSGTETSRIGALPLLIDGPLASPSFRIDTTAAVQDVLQNPEKSIERLKDLKGDIKKLKGNGLEQLQQLLGR